jgi:cobalt-precorrin-5B (C1)-methyltransferase
MLFPEKGYRGLAELRTGYSTGTCAAAAAKAALIKLLYNRDEPAVGVNLPQGGRVELPIKSCRIENDAAVAEVIKDAGDDLDVTHGISIFSRVEITGKPGVIIKGGVGIGVVTKPGLPVPAGEPAINPVPRSMITFEAERLLPPGKGAIITVFAPQGVEVAAKTLNSRLGIVGGISIIGTTGLVRPMSKEAYLDALALQISQAISQSQTVLVLTPGAIGARMAVKHGINGEAIIQTSNFIGDMLKKCNEYEITGIILFGHIGKLIKVAAGIFNTHSQIADARRETLAAHAALMGAPQKAIKEIMELNTLEDSTDLIKRYGLEAVYQSIARTVSHRSRQLVNEGIITGTVLYDLKSRILGYDEEARILGRKLGWKI